MDFKLILLLLGLGHLVVVVLYALWGFFGGLKRELKCTAVLLILLLLGWLIFSDPAMMMGIQLPGSLLSLLSSLGVEAQKASVWEVVLQVLQAQVPNGSALFVEGREAYELAYDVVAGALRGVGLIVITLGMLYLSGLIRVVSHIVKLIVTAVKKAKAKNALPVEAEEAPTEEEPEQVVVLGGIEGGDDVVVTTDVNELPAPKPITQRIWGGVVGLIKAVVVLCITFVPLSGVVSILDETSEETRDLLSGLVSGEEKLVEGEESSNVVDIVFDFVEDYKNSPLGLCVESSSYFFGDSFSTLLFDSLFYVSTDTQRIPLRTELVTFIHAANALEGDLDFKNLEQDKLSNALDELKDSQLLPELMPVAIEFAYEIEQVKEALIAANQEALDYARSIGYGIKESVGSNIYELDGYGPKVAEGAIDLANNPTATDISQNGVSELDIYGSDVMDPKVDMITNFIETNNDPHLMSILDIEVPANNPSQRIVTMKTEGQEAVSVAFPAEEFDKHVMPKIIDSYAENNDIYPENVQTSAPDAFSRAACQVQSSNNTVLSFRGYSSDEVAKISETITSKQKTESESLTNTNVRQKTIGTYPTNNDQNHAFVSMPVLFVICILFILMISLIIFAG